MATWALFLCWYRLIFSLSCLIAGFCHVFPVAPIVKQIKPSKGSLKLSSHTYFCFVTKMNFVCHPCDAFANQVTEYSTAYSLNHFNSFLLGPSEELIWFAYTCHVLLISIVTMRRSCKPDDLWDDLTLRLRIQILDTWGNKTEAQEKTGEKWTEDRLTGTEK